MKEARPAQKTCEAVAIHCIDFRVQRYLGDWLAKHFGNGNHDRVAIAGAARNLELVIGQVEIAYRLHSIRSVVLINHEDCGAYAGEGNRERHAHDLTRAQSRIQTLFPELHIETYYLHLDGTFEPLVSSSGRGQ